MGTTWIKNNFIFKLSRTGNMKKWNFYFGNLDPFRMVANSDFQKNLFPEKKFFRDDPYDNQVGEAEYANRGLYQEDVEHIKEIVDIHEISPSSI